MDRAVEAWSTERLNFEPKDWRVDFRRELASPARTLAAADGEVLHAVYSSVVRDACDAENVLIYNVGPGAFRRAARACLRFERAFTLPEQPPAPSSPLRHHHSYRLSAFGDAFTWWRRGGALASWDGVRCPRLTPDTKVATVWLAVRDHVLASAQPVVQPLDRFGLALTVRVPHGATFAPAACVKPIVDGSLAAWQAHDGSDGAEVARRIAAQVGESGPQRLDLLLRDASRALLGRRRLLRPWGRAGAAVQWNPADELCVAAELLVEQATGPGWELSGRLFEVAPTSER